MIGKMTIISRRGMHSCEVEFSEGWFTISCINCYISVVEKSFSDAIDKFKLAEQAADLVEPTYLN